MSEEEIIEIIEKLQCEYKEQQNDKKYNDYTVFKAKEYSKGLQGLLDLYKQEKEKNKELQKQANELVEQYEEELTEKNNYIFNLENEREALHKIIDKEFE